MNTYRIRLFLLIGLVLLLIVLFAATFALNKRQYRISVSNAEIAMSKHLHTQSSLILKDMELLEERRFALYRTKRCLEADLFYIANNFVMPVFSVGVEPTILKDEADRSFQKGIELLPKPEALSYFQKATQGPMRNRDELYQKISALFSVLEMYPNPQTVCLILFLLERQRHQLTPSQHEFFTEKLDESVPNLTEMKARVLELQETATCINKTLVRRKGAYRTLLDGKILSVKGDGMALLYTLELPDSSPVTLSQNPTGTSMALVPGLYMVVPELSIQDERERLRKQYAASNLIYLLMALLGSGLVAGILATMKQQRRLDAIKTNFIATVSHELRTPLSLIRLHAETLHHGRIPPEKVAEYRQTILTESERLSGIVNNVLDFSRMERNQLQIHLEPTDLSALCERIADSFRFRLEQDGFAMEKQIQPGIVAPADPLAFSQIVFNLVDNAIKYSDEEKSIRIELEHSGARIILRIADRGIGIPEKLKKKIFDDFVRSDDRMVTARRGSGIGLSVAHRLAQEMGGTIEVADNKPTGSIFAVTLKGTDETTGR